MHDLDGWWAATVIGSHRCRYIFFSLYFTYFLVLPLAHWRPATRPSGMPRPCLALVISPRGKRSQHEVEGGGASGELGGGATATCSRPLVCPRSLKKLPSTPRRRYDDEGARAPPQPGISPPTERPSTVTRTRRVLWPRTPTLPVLSITQQTRTPPMPGRPLAPASWPSRTRSRRRWPNVVNAVAAFPGPASGQSGSRARIPPERHSTTGGDDFPSGSSDLWSYKRDMCAAVPRDRLNLPVA